MRNFNFNWMKNAAKNTQTTGGGTSRRCEDVNQSRIASDPIPCRYRVDTVSLPCFGYTPGISVRLMKYAAMILCVLMLGVGQMWGATITINSSTTTSDALFPVSAAPTQYEYSSNSNVAGWLLIGMGTSSSITITNKTGATITAVTAEGVAQNNNDKTVNFTISDGTTTAETSSGTWKNRKSETLTSKALNATNVGKLKCDAGQTYTITNKASGSYDAGVRFIITYTSTLPTALTNGATTSTTQAVSWTAPSPAPANGYLVAYSTSSTAPANSVVSTTGAYTVVAIAAGTTNTTLSELGASTTYNWWVRSKNARGNSSWVAGSSFTTEAAAAGSGWGIAGTMNSWTAATDELMGSGTVSATISLDANTQYEFKVVDITNDDWYGNGGTIKGGITDWLFETSKGNTYLRTSCAGDYTFTFNTSTKNLSITYPNSNKVYFAKGGASWSKVYAYCYNDGDWNNGWPGVEITSNTEDNCGTEYYAYTNGYTYIIFNNGSSGDGNQTGNITVSGYEGKHAVGAAATGWTAYPTYTVTYNANGDGAGNATGTTGSVPTDASSPYACGSTVTVLGNTGSLAKSGYTFAGWNTAPGGGGTSYAADATFTISANTTLYAQWEEIKYTVTFNVNGGGSVDPTSATQVSGGASVTLPTPTWSGYTFDGWYNAGTKIGNGGASYTPTSNITLYAHWTDNISGKVFSFIDNNYGDKFKSFTGYGWVAKDSTGRSKTFTNASTGVEYRVSAAGWDKKNNAISALAKFFGGTSSMSIVIPTGKIATVKVSYGAYGNGDDYKLTINSADQAAVSSKLDNEHTNAQVISDMKEITLNSQTGTLTLGIHSSSKNLYIGRVSAVITGYTVSYAAGTYGSGSLVSGTKTHGSNFTLSSADDAFTRDGYVYDGWSINADGSTKDYNLGGSYTTDAPITLYPHWVAACSATQPGTISKGTLSACTLRLTAAGSPASNNTWYWQSSENGTDKTESGATKDVTSTGTYYIRSFCSTGSGCWSDAVQVTITAADMTPAAPTALAASSATAKGVTLTVTDAANTNDYEFYVSTSDDSDDIDEETTATHSVSDAKSLTITNLYAGTTFYAWARAKCGSNKSAWTALGDGGTFTTSTVTMTPTLTNVTKSSGATSGIGGSDYTAVFTADEEYSMPNPTVTIGGNAATSGTDYTWSVDGSEGTITIPANKINGNIAITLNSADAAPSSAVISGTYHYFPGDNISLTCTPSGNNGPTTYQWYKGGKSDEDNLIDGATSATYTKNSCAFADAGSYYCKVTCNETSIWAVTNSYENYDVKILRLYVNGSKSGEAYGNVDFTKVDGTTATASISLGSSWTYGFNIADGCGHYYGNAGTMTENNCTGWTTNVNGTDCGLTTTNAATYVFTINYSSLEAITTSVTYPTANQAASKVIYFDNQTVDWSTLHYRIGKSNHTQATAMTKVSGTNNLYKVTTAEYNGFSGWHIANNAGWTGSNSIYRTYTNGDAYSITYATAHEGGAVTDAAITVTPTTSKGTGSDTGINDNCTFYNYSLTTGMKTDRVTISPYSNGTITVNYVDTDDEEATLTSGYADLAHSVILTSITAVPNTGYNASAITINEGAYSANYVVTGATTVAATFTAKTTSLTLKTGAQGSGDDKTGITATFDSGTLTGLAAVHSATGYNLDGYYTAGGVKVLDNTGALVHTATDYTTSGGLWKCVDANLTLTAHWTAKTTTITIDANTANLGGTTPGSVTATYASALPSFTAAAPANTNGYQLTGYYTGATNGDKIINANGTLVVSTDYADGSGNWKYTDATCTLYPHYEAKTFSITYLDDDESTEIDVSPKSYTFGVGVAALPTPSKSGYRFVAWYNQWCVEEDEDGDQNPGWGYADKCITDEISTTDYGDATYIAKWVPLYTITNGEPANGTITVTSSAAAGDVVDITATPSSGYVFDGWNIYKTGTPATTVSPAAATASTSFTMPAYAVTVDATFVEQTYTLSYSIGTDATGSASGGSSAGSYPEDATITVPAKGTLDSTGCTFRGWTDGTTFYTAGQSFSMPASNVTLTAVWDGGTSCTEYEVLLNSGSLSTESSTAPKGYYITGRGLIMTSSDGSSTLKELSADQTSCHSSTTCFTTGSKIVAFRTYNAINKLTVYGIATGNRTLSSIKTGTTRGTYGDDIQGSCTVKVNGSTDTPSSHITWSKDVCGEIEITFPSTLAANTYILVTLSGNINVYGALFENCVKSGYTVSFDDQTGFSGSSTLPDDIEGIPSGKKILQPTAPTATNYKFGGWCTDAACTSAFSFSGTITKDTTLYAKWTEKSTPAGTTLTPTASSVCSGSSTTLTLNASTSGVEYELYEGETKLRTVTGTGSALSLGSTSNLTAAKTYTVKTVENEDYKGMTLSGATTTVTIAAATSVSVASTSLAATVGEAFTIDGITASGAGDLSYQWYSYTSSGSAGESLIAGAESDSYTFTPDETGSYYFKCAVTGDCGTVKSDMITVTASVAKTDPTVYELSGTTSVCEGDDATITLDGSDDGVTYALYLDGVDQSDDKVGDGNAITWTVIADGTYTVSAKADATYNAADMDGSAVISYKTATAIGTQPTTAVSGHDGVNFTLGSDLAATGEGTLTYQWYSYTSAESAGQATVGSATTTKTLTTSKAAGTYYYKVEVIATCGSVKSEMITVTVDNKHRITYDANNGSGAPSGNWKSPDAMTLPTDLPTRSGYIFLGWNTKDDGTGDMYQPGGSFTMPSSATTLYAAWASPCFTFSKGTKNTEPTDGTVMTPENINSSAFKGGATLSGGNMTNTSGATLGINGTYGFVMIKSTRELTLTLTGGQFQAGTVIELEGTTHKASGSKTYGFSISGNALTSLKTVDDSNTAFSQRYVVTASDGVEGEESCTITMNADASGSQTYLSAIKIGGCMACTSIHPTLTYSKTTIWMDDASLTASPTLNKDGSIGSATYVSNNTDVATVNESTGVVTAVARGTATITATIAADGTHCGKTATCAITVKSADCGYTEVAKLTRTSSSGSKGTISGPLAGNYGVNTQSDGKLGSNGHYMYLVLSSGHYYADGDSVYVTINKINDQGSYLTIRAGGKVPGADLAQLAKASLVVGANNGLRLSNVPANTDTITIYRKDGSDQNHQLDAITVKRYGCPDIYVYDNAAATDVWSDEDNWIGAAGHGSGLPTIDDRAIITKPIAVDIAHATASEVRLDKSSTNTGSLTIQANKGLEVAGKVQVWNGSALSATTPSDLLLESSSAGNATLIFDNSNSDQATVQMYSKGWTTGEQGGGTWNWQTVGVPVTDATRMNDYYGGYMYEWSGRWVDKTDMYGALTPFTAYSVSYPTGDEEHLHTYSIDGTLVPTGDKSISIPATTSVMALANSWTAPIHISNIEFTSEPANIFLYNTGYNPEGSAAGKGEVSGDRYAAGTYLCIPKNSAPYLDESYIAPMQGFYVKNKLSSAGTITINYNTVVRPTSDRAIVSGAMHAPKRMMSNLSEPAVLKMYVSDTQHDDRLVLLEREDFSRGFDNGWDGEKFQINAVKTAPRIFAINETGGKESVSAIPELENTVIGFRPGKEETYTIRFEYNGDETLYLRDTRTDAETLITNESEYVFLSDGTNEDARFIIVRVQSTPTGTEEIGAGSKAYKLMIEDHIYIIRDGRMYSVDGALVNLERK